MDILVFSNMIGKKVRLEKGKSRIAFPDDFTVINLVTTGLNPDWDEIIEIGAIRVRSGVPVKTFHSLVHPQCEIDNYITDLTGITKEELENAPLPENVFPVLFDFIGSDILVGHNVSFDINFLYDRFEQYLHQYLRNDFVCTMRMARKLLAHLPSHRLVCVAEEFSIKQKIQHRAVADCKTILQCFFALKQLAIERFGTSKTLQTKFKAVDLRTISAQKAQITDFRILGSATIKNGKSSTYKAELYKLKGRDIKIISESVFYDILEK